MIKIFIVLFALFFVGCSTNTSSPSVPNKPKMTKKSNCQSAFTVGAPLQFIIGGKIANPYLVSTKNCSILAIDPKSRSMAYRGYYDVKNTGSIVYHIKRAMSDAYHPPITMHKVGKDYYEGKIKGTIVALRSKQSNGYNSKASAQKKHSTNRTKLGNAYIARISGASSGNAIATMALGKYGRGKSKAIAYIRSSCREIKNKNYPKVAINACISAGISKYSRY